MRHFFLDTNVMVDFLTKRAPFGAFAADLFQLADEGMVTLHVSSLSFSHAFYLLRKSVGSAAARSLLMDLSAVVSVVAVDAVNVHDSLHSPFADFEDAIQYFAAASVPAITHLVTRDPKGFGSGQLPVISPAGALQLLA